MWVILKTDLAESVTTLLEIALLTLMIFDSVDWNGRGKSAGSLSFFRCNQQPNLTEPKNMILWSFEQ